MAPQQDSDPAATCPVDHKTREAWLKQARAQQSKSQPAPPPPPPPPPATTLQAPGCDSSQIDQQSPSSSSSSPPQVPSSSHSRLDTYREVSTIPRALPSSTPPTNPNAPAANHETETGTDKRTGNWIYPSEQMFFDALRRKSLSAAEHDMRTIVPIHNAVNERAWHLIKQWEAGRGGDACGGPRLASFSGLSESLTPRARWNTYVLGYKPPFDRHDWVVDRCGTRIEYVIDFYAGKDEGQPGKEVNFYLDVRPKLNSWEGVKMRAMRFMGL